jgi:hypothetical protein
MTLKILFVHGHELFMSILLRSILIIKIEFYFLINKLLPWQIQTFLFMLRMIFKNLFMSQHKKNI